jgi:hypothetical protein
MTVYGPGISGWMTLLPPTETRTNVIINNWIDGTGHDYVHRCGENGDELQVKGGLDPKKWTVV